VAAKSLSIAYHTVSRLDLGGKGKAQNLNLCFVPESYDIGLATISRLTVQRRPSWR